MQRGRRPEKWNTGDPLALSTRRLILSSIMYQDSSGSAEYKSAGVGYKGLAKGCLGHCA